MITTAAPMRLPEVEAMRVLARIVARRPRVQCLTNTVAQAITANLLLAAGADASMAVHPEEIVNMTLSADASLINLGTPDAGRERAIQMLAAMPSALAKPLVLDPVFIQHSVLRRRLAEGVLRFPALIIRGNAAEMASLSSPAGVVRVTTGAVDVIEGENARYEVGLGHPLMAKVTGLGCATSALIAAFAAVELDRAKAAAAALTILGLAGERAGRIAKGPASFAVSLIDSVHELAESSSQQSDSISAQSGASI
ncbi:MAG: hydroxyethylthiazole kinase [Bosea sp. (in: a-proteobacteria)]